MATYTPTCKVCGEPLPPRPEGAKGRPREFCPEDVRPCGVWMRTLTRLHSLGLAIMDEHGLETRRARHRAGQAMAGYLRTFATDLAGNA